MKYNGVPLTLPGAQDLLVSGLGRKPTARESAALAALVDTSDADIADAQALAALVLNKVLFVAIAAGDHEAVSAAFDAGAEADARDDRGRTPAMRACEAAQDTGILGFILNRRPDLAAQDRSGKTALHHAIESQQEQLVRLLLASGAPLDVKSKAGWTPLFTAGNQNGSASPAITRLVYQATADSRLVISDKDIKQAGLCLYQDAAFTPAVKSLLEDAFIGAAGGGFSLGPDLSDLAGRLRDRIAQLYDTMSASADRALTVAALSDSEQAMAGFALGDLSRIRTAALAEHDDTVEAVLKLIGHLAHATDTVRIGTRNFRLGGLDPTQALWYHALATAHLLGTKTFSDQEKRYLRRQLARTIETLLRAEELHLVERFFVQLDTIATTAARLALCYRQLVVAGGAGAYLMFPCGTPAHATYLTVECFGTETADLTMHNLGTLANKYHFTPKPRQLFPLVITSVDIESLSAIFERMISAYVLLDWLSDDEFKGFYDLLMASGSRLADPALTERFVPMPAQVADNCSVANLQSAYMAQGQEALGEEFPVFEERIQELEFSHALSLWLAIAGQDEPKPSIDQLRDLGRLRRAVYLGDEPTCDQMLSQNLKYLKMRDRGGRSLLHFAAQAGHADLVDLLLGYGADSRVEDRHGRVPIDYALTSERAKVLDRLLKTYPQRTLKTSGWLAKSVPFYRDTAMKGQPIAILDSGTVFYELHWNREEKWMKILVRDNNQKPFVGYIRTGSLVMSPDSGSKGKDAVPPDSGDKSKDKGKEKVEWDD